jgi:hypothetical protein
MSSYDINFLEVRVKDANYQKKNSEWSGQQVLDHNFNMAKSQSCVNLMNKVRVWPYGLEGFIKKFRTLVKMFVNTSFFDNSMTVCVLLNTIAMASDYYGISPEQSAFLVKANDTFTWIFICEMNLKFIAVGVKKYWLDKGNWIDGSVVMLSIIELAMAAIMGSGDGVVNL